MIVGMAYVAFITELEDLNDVCNASGHFSMLCVCMHFVICTSHDCMLLW